MKTVLTQDGLKAYDWEDRQYVEKPVECSWGVLRAAFAIEDGVTYGGLLELIEHDPFLHFFVAENYPLWNSYYECPTNSDHYPIRWTGYVNNGVFRFFSDSDAVPNKRLLLKLDPVVRILQPNGEQYHAGEYCWSFLDVLEAVFGNCKRQIEPGFVFKPEGLWHPDLDIVEDPFEYLVQECAIEEGVTLQNMFDFVSRHEDVLDFIRFYSWCYAIEEFHDEAKKPYIPNPDESPLIAINVARRVRFSRTFEKNPWTFGNHLDMSGTKGEDDLDSYALEFSPVNELAHLPLVYNKAVEIRQDATWSRKGNVKEEAKLIVKCVWPYTLIDLLDAIYDEISFCGSPESRDARLGTLRDRVDDYLDEEGDDDGHE